jgi:hypothetical protein
MRMMGSLATFKMYLKNTWPQMFQDGQGHVKCCLRCQQWKLSTEKPMPLKSLTIQDRPNLMIHADIFGPMITANSNKKFVQCITDAFTKYAVVMVISKKDAETVAGAPFQDWFCRFGIPAQVHTDGGKEFVNRISAALFQLPYICHTKTSPPHPQCNTQVEVFNKTVKNI